MREWMYEHRSNKKKVEMVLQPAYQRVFCFLTFIVIKDCEKT